MRERTRGDAKIVTSYTCGTSDSIVTRMSMDASDRKQIPIAALLILAVATFAARSAFAFSLGSILNNEPDDEGFKIITVANLEKMLANPDSHVHIYDANPEGVRESEGMIPGARPLTSSDNYDVANELPSNRNAMLVFYCHNLH
jgi:hypothetical protein